MGNTLVEKGFHSPIIHAALFLGTGSGHAGIPGNGTV